MGNVPEVSFERGSRVWVWDSTWLPAVVVGLLEADCVSVRLEHGVTFSVAAANLAGRDPLPVAMTFLALVKGFTPGAIRSQWLRFEGGSGTTSPT